MIHYRSGTTFLKRYKCILIQLLFSFTALFADNAGINPDSSSIWRKTVPLTPLPCGKFSNFEGKVPNQNALKKYWYGFDDKSMGGNSQILGDTTLVTESGLYTLNWYDGTGSSGNDTGMQFSYLIGDPVKQGDVLVRGFAGVGCNVYDSVRSIYWDAKSAGAKSIYFHYITIGSAPFLTLEIRDINDVADKNSPERKDLRGPGVVWHKNFPNTANKWVAVELPFDSLVINVDTNKVKAMPLDLTKLAKFTWNMYGEKGDSGTVAIDNVYFSMPCYCVFCITSNIMTIPNKNNTAIVASYTNKSVNVSLERGLASGTFNIFKSNGVCIESQSFSSKLVFSLTRFPAGMYFVKINAFDGNRNYHQYLQIPVTIVK